MVSRDQSPPSVYSFGCGIPRIGLHRSHQKPLCDVCGGFGSLHSTLRGFFSSLNKHGAWKIEIRVDNLDLSHSPCSNIARTLSRSSTRTVKPSDRRPMHPDLRHYLPTGKRWLTDLEPLAWNKAGLTFCGEVVGGHGKFYIGCSRCRESS